MAKGMLVDRHLAITTKKLSEDELSSLLTELSDYVGLQFSS